MKRPGTCPNSYQAIGFDVVHTCTYLGNEKTSPEAILMFVPAV